MESSVVGVGPPKTKVDFPATTFKIEEEAHYTRLELT